MSEMVRKQIYIQKRQERLIKHLSKARGISEAEIIRQAIEGEAVGAKSYQSKPDHAAWEEILRFVESRKILSPRGRPYQWKRQDAYAERERRFK